MTLWLCDLYDCAISSRRVFGPWRALCAKYAAGIEEERCGCASCASVGERIRHAPCWIKTAMSCRDCLEQHMAKQLKAIGLKGRGLDEWKGWRVERAKGWRARLLLHLPTTHMLKHFMFFHRWVAVPIRSSVQINCQWCDYTKRASSKTKNGLSKLEAKE